MIKIKQLIVVNTAIAILGKFMLKCIKNSLKIKNFKNSIITEFYNDNDFKNFKNSKNSTKN